MDFDFDGLVIGAGVVGLAVARAASLDGWRVLLVDRAAKTGSEVSSRNSEVIHAGLYYPPGSLKARLCVRGRDQLLSYCQSRSIPFRRCGKLVIATEHRNHSKLESLMRNGLENGVSGLKLLSGSEARALEPELRCTLALESPVTAILDAFALMNSLRADFESAGGLLSLRTEFVSADPLSTGFQVNVLSAGERSRFSVHWIINSAGLSAPDVAGRINGVMQASVPRAYYAKGSYFSISSKPFSRLIYPLHSNAGLGIHATVDLAAQVRFGPDVEWVAQPSFDVDPRRADSFYAEIRSYWPGLRDGALTPSYAGVRPKIVGPGEPAADFIISGPSDHGLDGLYQLYGIESPGLTAALALADELRVRLRSTV